jgi:cytoskeletal protein CcmA (bactofilin family)
MAARPASPAATPLTSDRPAAPAAAARTSAKRVLTVGPDIQMKGEITTCDRVVIEGMVDATMRDVHTVELAETGSLKGTAEVEDAEISGAFEGDLVVRGKITIYTTGRVRGNITYGEIEIQRGGQISGNIRNVAEAKAAGAKKAA